VGQLTLSYIVYGEPGGLRALLDRSGMECQLSEMAWGEAWEKLVKAAIYRTGPDVSQVGAPWVSNFVAMSALRPFSKREVGAMGGPPAFLSAAWESTMVAGERRVWAMPWLADVRVIYYWRDVLEQVGVDEGTAFQTPERMEETLARLQAGGVESPWLVPVRYPFATLHCLVSWVWGAGGDLVSADERRVLFAQPDAHAAMRAYFSLHRYLPPEARQLDGAQLAASFADREVAVAMATPNWLAWIKDRYGATTDVASRLGVALPPGPAYIGGSNLAIWQHTRREQDAVELVRFLTGRQAQVEYSRHTGYLPVRLDVLDKPPYATDPQYRVMVEALRTGRSYPPLLRWGMVEERLSTALTQIWDEVLADPGQDLDEVIARHLEPLARRLEVTLAGAG
jgi:multiple sugar transport system substrate-binding protein